MLDLHVFQASVWCRKAASKDAIHFYDCDHRDTEYCDLLKYLRDFRQSLREFQRVPGVGYC